MSPLLKARLGLALAVLERDGWIVHLGPDATGAICHGFDRNPDARGFVLAYEISGDRASIEVGCGVGDAEADLAAAVSVAEALRSHGLLATATFRDGAALVEARVPEGGAS